MPWNHSTTGWSWRRIAACSSASWLLAASAAFLAASPVQAAIECDPETGAMHAQDADVVFAGTVIETFEDRSRPAPWVPAVVAEHWPDWLPMPTVQGSSGVAAVRFRASAVYKGRVPHEVVVHLFGTGPRFARGQRWTVFANRDASLGLFTTECSGDERGALANPAAYGLTVGSVTGQQEISEALLGPLIAVLVAAALAASVMGVQALRSRGRTQPG